MINGQQAVSDLRDRRILVTGGAGFIGTEVVRQFANRFAKVTVLDNLSSGKPEYLRDIDGLQLVRGDIRDRESVRNAMKDCDLVVHLAALPFIPDSYCYPEDFFAVNTIGTVNIIQSAIESRTVERLVHISSSEVYGTAKYTPMDEEHPTLPHSTYAVSKLAADRAVFTAHKEQGFPVVIIRPFNSFGPCITQPYIIPEIIIQLLLGNRTVELGNIHSSRDFTYVGDTAAAIISASETKAAEGETINVGSGTEVTIRRLVEIIGEIMGKEVTVLQDSSRLRPYDVERLVCDNKRAHDILRWAPRVPLKEGLELTIDWVRNNRLEFRSPFKGWPRDYRDHKETD